MKMKKLLFQLIVRLDVISEATCTDQQRQIIRLADQMELPFNLEPKAAAEEFRDYFHDRNKPLPHWMRN